MGEDLFDNILGEQEIETLFTDVDDAEVEDTKAGKASEKEIDVNEKEDDITEVDPENLFDDEEDKEKPESVGDEDDNKEGKEDTTTVEDDGTSPNNFYSSIANALAVDGIFPNLDEETIKKADSAEALSDLIESEVNARLDDKQQRIAKALENGVEPSAIKNYENTLNYIASIKDADINEESEQAEQLRYRLIFQDFINKGYSQERADKLAKRSIDAGTDIEDAKDALQSNKEFFQSGYNKLLREAQEKADNDKKEREKEAVKLKDSILKDKDLMGDIELSRELRNKVYDNIAKPVYKDPETGQYLTAVQKFERDHKADFLKYVGLFMTLTDGFKDFESFTKGKVKKEVKKGLRELENTLNSTRRNGDGSLKMVSSAKEDPESWISDFKLAL